MTARLQRVGTIAGILLGAYALSAAVGLAKGGHVVPLPVVVQAAVFGCLCCLAIAGALACRLGHACAAVLGVYLTMNLAYCFWLKHAVLVDVMVIALGFVCRVLAGVYAGVRGSGSATARVEERPREA